MFLASVVLAGLVAGACGSGQTGSGQISATVPSTDDRGVAVAVLGVLRDHSICPVGQARCASAVRLEGDTGAVAAGDVVAGTGWYDGERVLLAGPLTVRPSPLSSDPSYASLCPDRANPDGVDLAPGVDAANRILYGPSGRDDAGSPDLALVWVDNSKHVFTYWFAHDVERYRQPIEDAFAPAAVCVVDGATFSERELFAASRAVGELTRAGVFLTQGGWGIGRSNRLVVSIEALDPSGRSALDALPAVVPVPFLELLDRPLADLPKWRSPVAGDVDLLTDERRATQSMLALGTYSLRYDRTGNCVYADLPIGGRLTFLWPFGFAARRSGDEAIIYDASGREFARTGAQYQLGGGGGSQAPSVAFAGRNICDATGVWIVSDAPAEVVSTPSTATPPPATVTPPPAAPTRSGATPFTG